MFGESKKRAGGNWVNPLIVHNEKCLWGDLNHQLEGIEDATFGFDLCRWRASDTSICPKGWTAL